MPKLKYHQRILGAKMHIKPRLIAFIIGSLQASLVQADHSLSLTEADLLGDIPLVSAASRFAQRLDQAPASITIIDQALIRQSGALNLADVFRLVPGFQSYSVSGNRFGVSYHGIGKEFPNQLEVMVDGRSVYESLFSSVHWSTLGIELGDIDHIEVVRGSNAAAQGSNAYLGSINIVTRQPEQDSGLAITAIVGDWQTRRSHVRYNNSAGAINYRVNLSYDENDGFPSVAAGELDDGHRLYHGNVKTTYTPTLFDKISFSGGYSHDRTGWGDSDHPNEYSLAQAYSSYQSFKWLHSHDDGNDVEFHVYHNNFDIKNWEALGVFADFLGFDPDTARALSALNPTPTPILAQVAERFGSDNLDLAQKLVNELNTPIWGGFGRMRSERYDGQLQFNFRLSPRFRGTWGVGLRNEKLTAYHPQSINRDENELIARLYGHNEWQLSPQLTLNSGVMIEDSPQDVLVSPRISANFRLTPQQLFRIAYARGNRAPSLLEANEHLLTQVNGLVVDNVRIADPDLKEEKLDSFEFGYLLQLPNPDIAIDLRFFHERMTEVINAYSLANAPEDQFFGDKTHKFTTNLGAWDIVGGEIQLNYQPSSDTLIRLHYTNVDLDTPLKFRVFPNTNTITRGNRLARHSGALLLAHSFNEQWSASTSLYYQSKVRWDHGDIIDGYSRVDTQLSYHFNIGNNEANIRLIAQNLGSDYNEFSNNNRFGTRFFLVAELALPE